MWSMAGSVAACEAGLKGVAPIVVPGAARLRSKGKKIPTRHRADLLAANRRSVDNLPDVGSRSCFHRGTNPAAAPRMTETEPP
ncbi:hypothetical protein GCM10028794_10270 [Silanimonas algicola]